MPQVYFLHPASIWEALFSSKGKSMAIVVPGSPLQRQQAATETANTSKHDNHHEHCMQGVDYI